MLICKKYFLCELERFKFEELIFEKLHQIDKEDVLVKDDKELLMLLKNIYR